MNTPFGPEGSTALSSSTLGSPSFTAGVGVSSSTCEGGGFRFGWGVVSTTGTGVASCSSRSSGSETGSTVESAHESDAHHSRKIRIFTKRFPETRPARIASEVEYG